MAISKINHTQLSNEFIDDYMSKLSPKAIVVFIAISRKTIGWQKTSDLISHSQLREMTGMSTNTIKSAVEELEEMDLIKVDKSGLITRYDINYADTMSKSDRVLCQNLTGGVSKYDIDKPKTMSNIDTTKESNIKKLLQNKEKEKESLSACADEEKKTQDYDINNIDPITNNPYSFINYMYNRIEEEHNKLTPQDPYKRNEDFFIRKLFDSIDKTTFDGKLNALITRIKNTKDTKYLLTLTAKTLLNKLNELQIVAEPPKINNRFKSGNVRPATKSLTLREQILSTPGLADKYCLADVYEDEAERGINSAECIKLQCYSEV